MKDTLNQNVYSIKKIMKISIEKKNNENKES